MINGRRTRSPQHVGNVAIVWQSLGLVVSEGRYPRYLLGSPPTRNHDRHSRPFLSVDRFPSPRIGSSDGNSILGATRRGQPRALLTLDDRVAGRSRARRWVWTSLTHLGGIWGSIGAAITPLAGHGALALPARQAVATLACSHIIVQLIKRTVGRRRPSNGVGYTALIDELDQFSFPSGHSATAMSVAIVYAFAFPATAAVLIPLAVLVGVRACALAFTIQATCSSVSSSPC